MIPKSITSAYSQVRESRFSAAIQQTVPSVRDHLSKNTSQQRNEPVCECPHCNNLTEISINYINPGETKQTYCQKCNNDFDVEFTENKSWKFHK